MDNKLLMYTGKDEYYGKVYYSSFDNLKPDGNKNVRIFYLNVNDNQEYYYDVEVNEFKRNYIEISAVEYDFIIHMYYNWTSFEKVYTKVIESIYQNNKQVVRTL